MAVKVRHPLSPFASFRFVPGSSHGVATSRKSLSSDFRAFALLLVPPSLGLLTALG